MQFVRNGPDVPERLLQAHEDGRVVLFCGAGISYPARLPGFAGLVKRIYADLHVTPDRMQRAAIKAKRFDTAIGLLEGRTVGGRAKVRRKVAEILTPNLGAPNATATHEALLTLGRNREGRTRLVTTNFDRLFEEVITKKDLDVERIQAPLLPVPKSRWNGLVYLHGRLPTNANDENLDHLILSSGDFGLAYLTERWAARFVGELFRNYTVCFVGYSLDDPVLRYMTDALAADRLLGESPAEMFAFGSHSMRKESDRAEEWKAKNVTPILYRKYRRHWYLHKTLRAWADTHRDGIRGKERIVVECASSRPLASTKQDDFVGRVLWALSDPSGLPAKRFADLDPVPPLDWLKPLSEDRYNQTDLSRFGVPSDWDEDNTLEFSLIRRPSPHTHAPWMTLVDYRIEDGTWDNVMRNLARWLTRHLDDPAVVLWLVDRGGRIHREFADLIELRMEELDTFTSQGKMDELNRIRANAPRAVPRPLMRTLWWLLLTGRVKSPSLSSAIFRWSRRFKRDGLTAALRLDLRDILTPRVSFRMGKDRKDNGGSDRLDDLVHWQVVLSSDDVYSEMHDLLENPRWIAALPDMLDDFSRLLRDTMDLMRELGGADKRNDPSYTDQPSISDHPQNNRLRDWTALIELTRDSWLETVKVSPERARLAAESWSLAPYPVFRRLAYFAATQEGVIPPRQGLDWLLADDHWWLWSAATMREAIRLLVTLAPVLDAKLSAELERAVLAGPPSAMYKPDIETERWKLIVEHGIWLRLAKMADTRAILTVNEESKLSELTSQHPDWTLDPEDRDEFPIWMSVGSGWRKSVATPRRRGELVDWLRQHREKDIFQDDDWSRRCLDDFPTTACALYALASDGEWPLGRWREALYVWSEEKLIKRSWRYMRPVLADAPDDVLQTLAPGVGLWLEHVARTLDGYDPQFLEFCKRVLALDHDVDEDGEESDPVGQAINHPVGRVTEALLNLWTAASLEDEQGLAPEFRSIFTELCDVRIGKFRHGRVLLATRGVTLFRVDREWAVQHLLPLFDWKRCQAEAHATWEGFLWAPRIYRPLMDVIKDSFLDTASYYGILGRHGEQYSALLTFAALDPGDTFSKQALARATEALPEEGLRYAAHALFRALEGAGSQRAEHWQHRILPYLQKIWPKSIDRRTPAISTNLGSVCIAAQGSFPDAVAVLREWLLPPPYPGLLMHRLKKSELCRKFPEPALEFLDLIIGMKTPPSWGLRGLLKEVRTAEPRLANDSRFHRLRELLHGGGLEL